MIWGVGCGACAWLQRFSCEACACTGLCGRLHTYRGWKPWLVALTRFQGQDYVMTGRPGAQHSLGQP